MNNQDIACSRGRYVASLKRAVVACVAITSFASFSVFAADKPLAQVNDEAEPIVAGGTATDQPDAGTGETVTVLRDEAGEVIGWMEKNGAVYDLHGNLVAHLNADGNVVDADGTVLIDVFGAAAPSRSGSHKLTWAWGLPPKIRFNRSETRRVDAYGSLVVAPFCAAGAALVSTFGTPAAGAAFGVACLAQTSVIIGTARYAVRHNRCLQLAVPTSIPSTWGC